MKKVMVDKYTDKDGNEHVVTTTTESFSFGDLFKKKEKPAEGSEENTEKKVDPKKIGITLAVIGAGVGASIFGYSKFRKSKDAEADNYLPEAEPLNLPDYGDNTATTSETATENVTA